MTNADIIRAPGKIIPFPNHLPPTTVGAHMPDIFTLRDEVARLTDNWTAPQIDDSVIDAEATMYLNSPVCDVAPFIVWLIARGY